MDRCKVDGCPEKGDQIFGLALARADAQGDPVSAEGRICLAHANALWELLGTPPLRATQAMAEELCNEINDGAGAVVISMPREWRGCSANLRQRALDHRGNLVFHRLAR
jgi:hypothetical protein